MTTREAITPFGNAEVIHAYTRAQALAEGGLKDVSDQARAHLFRHPVAFTAAAYAELVAGYSRWKCIDEEERLHEVLDTLASCCRTAPPMDNRMVVTFGTRDGEGVPYLLDVVAVCGPGDDGEPVITVMLPEDE